MSPRHPFVQRYVWQTGRNLFDILNQLPEFGIGRVVTLGRWQHFSPDKPSYYRITRVKLDCASEDLNYGEAWGIPTTEGYTKEGVEVKIPTWHLREWILVRKSEEADFCAYTPRVDDFKRVPKYTRMPPLLEEIVYRERKARGHHGVTKPIRMRRKVLQGLTSQVYYLDDEDDQTMVDYHRENVDIDDVGDLSETIKYLEDLRKPMKKWDWEDIWKTLQEGEN